MIRIGIVGVGATVSIAHYHVEAYKDDDRCCVSAVYDINKDGAGKFVQAHGLDAVIAEDFDSFLDKVDAVSICTPNAFHFEYASKALKRGKHVLVEKPLGVEINECIELERIASTSQAKSAIGLVYRFSDVIMKAKNIINENFSKFYTISGWFGGKRLSDPTIPFEWRMDKKKSGTGALGDFTSHLFDIVSFITGLKVDSVEAMSSRFIPTRLEKNGEEREVENDDATSVLASAGNTLIQFTVSRVGMDDVFILMTGDGGMIEISLRQGGSLKYWPKKKDGGYDGSLTVIPVERELSLESWFNKEIPAFLDLIEGKESAIASISDGLYVEKIIEAALSSSVSGRRERI
ncbi:MAG: Gfo/Idh/MocA family protein [Candidatus Ornithospirochaeta sp.]